MRNMTDNGKTIANSIPILAAFVVFVGYQLGIYTNWKNYYDQIFDFNRLCTRHYYSHEDAILAWKMSRQNPYIAEEISDFAHHMLEPKVASISKLEISLPFYFEISGA